VAKRLETRGLYKVNPKDELEEFKRFEYFVTPTVLGNVVNQALKIAHSILTSIGSLGSSLRSCPLAKPIEALQP
jgi:hypothetical protein